MYLYVDLYLQYLLIQVYWSTIWHLLAVCPFTDLFDGGICCYSYWCIMNVLFIKYHFICHGYMLELLYILSCEKEKKSFCDVTETRNPERSIFHELTYRGLSTGSWWDYNSTSPQQFSFHITHSYFILFSALGDFKLNINDELVKSILSYIKCRSKCHIWRGRGNRCFFFLQTRTMVHSKSNLHQNQRRNQW